MINLELPDLPYSKDALAPYMSAETLELHHDKHHMAYVTNGNKFITVSYTHLTLPTTPYV